jgi:uncharacterized protein
VAPWNFYGRRQELVATEALLARGKFFFCAISGRRRIGKTTLIQEVLRQHGHRHTLYVQIPDSDERGVIQAFEDSIEDMGASRDVAQHVCRSFGDIAAALEALWKNGVVTVLDEFQYFNRKALSAFPSHLQTIVDRAQTPHTAEGNRTHQAGGLITLGSIHTEMTAILDDKASPLFNRVTDRIDMGHWDAETLFELFREHAITDSHHQLFLWSIFEGVPKFYRDCFAHGVLVPSADYRINTLRTMFFEGSSPLRDEAENWFLRELRGRYDIILTLLARNRRMTHGDLRAEFGRTGEKTGKALGGYLQVLIDKYGIVSAKRPIFSGKERNVRYGITDNFLSAWLFAIQRQVRAARIQPLAGPLARAGQHLATHEGVMFEKFVHQCIDECSKKGVGDFLLTESAAGYWAKGDVEIDVIAINSDEKLVRFGSCKRTSTAHDLEERSKFEGHIARFFATKDGLRMKNWRIQKALYAPVFDPETRTQCADDGYLCYDMATFATWLRL